MDPTPSRRNHESTSRRLRMIERFTGYVLVSGYNITLGTSQEFPPGTIGQSRTESEGDDGLFKDVPSSWSHEVPKAAILHDP